MGVLYKIQGWWIDWPMQDKARGEGVYIDIWRRLFRDFLTSS